MKYHVAVLVGKVLDFEVEAEDEETAEAEAVKLATHQFEEEGIKDPDYEVDSVVETDSEEESDLEEIDVDDDEDEIVDRESAVLDEED
jgi:hypothetical protein